MVCLDYVFVPSMHINSTAYFKATHVLNTATLSELVQGKPSKHARTVFLFTDSPVLIKGKSLFGFYFIGSLLIFA